MGDGITTMLTEGGRDMAIHRRSITGKRVWVDAFTGVNVYMFVLVFLYSLHSLIYAITHQLTHPATKQVIHSLPPYYSITHSLTHSLIHPLTYVYPSRNSLAAPNVDTRAHAFTLAMLTHSLAHSLNYPLTH